MADFDYSPWLEPSDPEGQAIVHALTDIVLMTGKYGEYYAGNRDLTRYGTEQTKNVEYLWNWGYSKGYTREAIAAMAGNMTVESYVNPARWQKVQDGMPKKKQGYGLVQWTPYWKYGEWCYSKQLPPPYFDSALARLEWEIYDNPTYQWQQHKDYKITFEEFLHTSDQTIDWMAKCFFYNYERGSNPETRTAPSEHWYEYLGGVTPTPTGDIPVWLLFKIRKGGISL